MNIVPSVKVVRFEQLDAGEIFAYVHDRGSCLALKTEKPANGDRNSVVPLGPQFPYDANEAFILPWQPTTVISYGRDYCVFPPTDPSGWFFSGDIRKPVCLAAIGEGVYVCANGESSPQRFFPCFVEFGTGKIIEDRPRGLVAYTNHWEIALLQENMPPRVVAKFPIG